MGSGARGFCDKLEGLTDLRCELSRLLSFAGIGNQGLSRHEVTSSLHNRNQPLHVLSK